MDRREPGNLSSLHRKAEHEQILAEASSRLVTTLIDLTAFSKELLTRLDNPNNATTRSWPHAYTN